MSSDATFTITMLKRGTDFGGTKLSALIHSFICAIKSINVSCDQGAILICLLLLHVSDGNSFLRIILYWPFGIFIFLFKLDSHLPGDWLEVRNCAAAQIIPLIESQKVSACESDYCRPCDSLLCVVSWNSRLYSLIRINGLLLLSTHSYITYQLLLVRVTLWTAHTHTAYHASENSSCNGGTYLPVCGDLLAYIGAVCSFIVL